VKPFGGSDAIVSHVVSVKICCVESDKEGLESCRDTAVGDIDKNWEAARVKLINVIITGNTPADSACANSPSSQRSEFPPTAQLCRL
jgi:hypothetical protein